MPCDYSKYPANWKTEIRPRILAREGHKCKFCGAPDRTYIVRLKEDPARYFVWEYSPEVWEERHIGLEDAKLTLVILTIAHLDWDVDNNDDNNLAALCQRCHLLHDIKCHTANRKYNKNPLLFQLPKRIKP